MRVKGSDMVANMEEHDFAAYAFYGFGIVLENEAEGETGIVGEGGIMLMSCTEC